MAKNVVALLDLENHPIEVVRNIIDNCFFATFSDDVRSNPSFNLFHYPRPGSGNHDHFVPVGSKWMESDEIQKLNATLAHDRELALASSVYDQGKHYQIPMIDFDGRCTLEMASKAVAILKKEFAFDIEIFASGNGYHGYGVALLTQEDWYNWLGNLLLINDPNGRATVDARWVGHCLTRGYCGLRWSANTAHSKSVPTRIAIDPYDVGTSSPYGAVAKPTPYGAAPLPKLDRPVMEEVAATFTYKKPTY